MQLTLAAGARMLYFAYGSNLDETQMRRRCPDAEPILCAVLPDHALAFGGFSRTWGGSVASVVHASGARVHGLLYRISEPDLRTLDRHEGHPRRYRRVTKTVLDLHERRHEAATYVLPAQRFAPGEPTAEYLDVLRRAYERLGFDPAALSTSGYRSSAGMR